LNRAIRVFPRILHAFLVVSDEDAVCPVCGVKLAYRDRRVRIYQQPGGRKDHLIIRRLRCPKCGGYHCELPDCIAPEKHYASKTIEDVLDGSATSDDLDTEDYPCEHTMDRWDRWLRINSQRIDGYLRSIGYRLLGLGMEFLKSQDSLLTKLRNTVIHGWLPAVLRIIVNSGGSLVPYRDGRA
jgi:hypothetical protein